MITGYVESPSVATEEAFSAVVPPVQTCRYTLWFWDLFLSKLKPGVMHLRKGLLTTRGSRSWQRSSCSRRVAARAGLVTLLDVPVVSCPGTFLYSDWTMDWAKISIQHCSTVEPGVPPPQTWPISLVITAHPTIAPIKCNLFSTKTIHELCSQQWRYSCLLKFIHLYKFISKNISTVSP